MKKATIADVARLAGVSIKTVSRVTMKEPNVREDTRVGVSKAIAGQLDTNDRCGQFGIAVCSL